MIVKLPKRNPPDAVHVARALDFYTRWNKILGFGPDVRADEEVVRAYVQYLAEEIADIETGTNAWNRAIDACIGELTTMKNEDAQRLAKRIRKLAPPKRSTNK